MGRKPKAATEGAETTAAPVRRRRRTTVDHTAQVRALIASLISSRGEEGASQADALAVAMWARGVHEESAALKLVAGRARKSKAPGVAERLTANEVNKALLDGVLSGTLAVNVAEDGSVVFSNA